MKSLLLKETKQGYIERISKLTPQSKAVWGKMDAAQMMNHLNDFFQVANRKKIIKGNPIISFLLGRILRSRIINTEKPLPKNLGNAPLPAANNFEIEKKTLIDFINDTDIRRTEQLPLSMFGKMSSKEWDSFLVKQLEHHLKQFEV